MVLLFFRGSAMNSKGNYAAFIALMAVSIVFFVAISSHASSSSAKTELYKERFRQVPLIVQNMQLLYDQMTVEALIDFYPHDCTSESGISVFVAKLEDATDAISDNYNMLCSTEISPTLFSSGSGTSYTVEFDAKLNCIVESPFSFEFIKTFKIKKEVIVVSDPLTPEICSLVSVTDAYSGKPEYP